jgi:hypothetical protein
VDSLLFNLEVSSIHCLVDEDDSVVESTVPFPADSAIVSPASVEA